MAGKIPLKCDICSKKPRFSDVSHLLTHISSKTHLSNLFKARVRLEVDTEARRLIEDYDQWYAEWNIHDLLAERMTHKEHRLTKPRARGGNRGANARRRESTATPKESTPTRNSTNGSVPMQNMDPNLLMHPQMPFPNGHIYHGAQSNMAHLSMQTGMLAYHQQGPYTMHGQVPWSMLPAARMQEGTAYQAPSRYQASIKAERSRPSSSVPSKKRRRTAAVNCDAKNKRLRLQTHDTESRTPGSPSEDETEEEDEDMKSTPVEPDPETDAVCAEGEPWPQVILKGVYWEGMDCFDAAEPHQRSQRNQKKSHEAYMLLCNSSAQVAEAPFEVIFKIDDDAVWVFIKSRVITGNPSPSSIASSSPGRSHRSSPAKPVTRGPSLRWTRKRKSINAKDEQTDTQLRNAICGVGARRRFDVYRGDLDDDDAASDRTFAPRHTLRPSLTQPIYVNPNKENDRFESASASAAAISKTDRDGTESEPQIALPSIERGNQVSPMSRTITNPIATPFLPSTPRNAFTAPTTAAQISGPMQQHGFTLQPAFGRMESGPNFAQSRPYLPSLSRTNPSLSLYNGSRSVMGPGNYRNGVGNFSALDNLATAASQDYSPQPLFATPDLQASPPYGPMSPNAMHLHTAFQSPDWPFVSPVHNSHGYHGRYSSQSWGFSAPVASLSRGLGFQDVQDRHVEAMESKPGPSSTEAVNVNMATAGFVGAHSPHGNVGFHAERWNSHYAFPAHDTFGFANGHDAKPGPSYGYLPAITAAPMAAYGFGGPLAMPAATQNLPSRPTTPTRVLTPSAAFAEATAEPPEIITRASPRHSEVQEHRSHPASAVGSPKASNNKADRDRSTEDSGVDGLAPLQDEAIWIRAMPEIPADHTGDTTSDEDRTVTAPPTPSGKA